MLLCPGIHPYARMCFSVNSSHRVAQSNLLEGSVGALMEVDKLSNERESTNIYVFGR